jgi:tetratricopeptide (TPR) repeat protein
VKTFLRNTACVLILILLIAIAGDYFNFPLWPIDLLATNFSVEIQVDFADIDSGLKEKLLARSQNIRIELCEPGGQVIRKLYVDGRGVARFVVREGRYELKASVPVVADGNWSFLAYPSDAGSLSGIVKINQTDTALRIVLEKTRNIPEDNIDAVFRIYLMDADFQSAKVFALEMAENIARDMDLLLDIQHQLAGLPITAYNSILRKLTQATVVLDSYGVPREQQILRVSGEIIHVTSRYTAVKQARNSIVSKHLEILQSLYAAENLIGFFQEWNTLTGNEEIYEPSLADSPEFSDDIRQMEAIISNYSTVFPNEIVLNYKEAVDRYESGDLQEARAKFSRLLSITRNVNLGPDHEDMESTIIEYIEDIELISKANYAMRTDNLEKAEKLYDLVSKPNKLVHDRILEIKRYMQLRGIGEPE